jgi:hypothetical protein
MAVRLSALRADRHLPSGRFLVLISVRGWVDPWAIVRLEGTRTRNLPACSIVPQPTTLPRGPLTSRIIHIKFYSDNRRLEYILAWLYEKELQFHTQRWENSWKLAYDNGILVIPVVWNARTSEKKKFPDKATVCSHMLHNLLSTKR